MPEEELIAEVCARGGAIALCSIVGAHALLVRPRGYVGPTLLRRELRLAAEFGRRHQDGWSYVVDVEAVRLVNPGNVFALRSIRQLPNLRSYIVVSPSRVVRLAAAAVAPIVKPDAIVPTLAEAVGMAQSSNRSGSD